MSVDQTTRSYLEGFEMVLDWVSGLDFAATQASLSERQVPRTGQWFLNLATVKWWMETDNHEPDKPALLCQGIPGAGKTQLVALLVARLAALSEDNRDRGVAYIYCSERDNHSSYALLSSLVRQLSRGRQEQQLVARLRALHDNHQPRGSVPSSLEVAELLEYVVTLYPHVYLVVDGLDEMSMEERGSFLRALGVLCRRQKYVRLLAMARWGIEYQFKEHFDKYATQVIRATEQDIMAYVQHQLSNHHRLPEQLQARRDEITKTVVASAGEM